jgi:hypothetical protein
LRTVPVRPGGGSRRINEFLASRETELNGLDLRGLLPKMIKGTVGCEAGCPSDAKGFVSRGFQRFELAYIEGGILSAKAATPDGRGLQIRIFPEF